MATGWRLCPLKKPQSLLARFIFELAPCLASTRIVSISVIESSKGDCDPDETWTYPRISRWVRYRDVVPWRPNPMDSNVPRLDEPDEEPITAATMAARMNKG